MTVLLSANVRNLSLLVTSSVVAWLGLVQGGRILKHCSSDTCVSRDVDLRRQRERDKEQRWKNVTQKSHLTHYAKLIVAHVQILPRKRPRESFEADLVRNIAGLLELVV